VKSRGAECYGWFWGEACRDDEGIRLQDGSIGEVDLMCGEVGDVLSVYLDLASPDGLEEVCGVAEGP